MYIPKTLTIICETPSDEIKEMQIAEMAHLARRVLIDDKEPKVKPKELQITNEGR
jgi:hypothetical protein